MCLACSKNILGCQYGNRQENERKNCRKFGEKYVEEKRYLGVAWYFTTLQIIVDFSSF